MGTIVIVVIAAGLSAAVVWWASTPPGTPVFRRRDSARKAARAALSFRETFQPTGPEPATVRAVPEEGFLGAAGSVPDERPPRVLSLLRIALTIALVAVLGVGVLGFLSYLVKLQLDKFLGGS